MVQAHEAEGVAVGGLARIRHVMVVDDEEFVRKFVVRALQQMGCRVTAFSNGREAVEFFNGCAEEVDLVITDMKMPGMDGAATFRELRKRDPAARVLLASGFAAEEAVDDCMKEGALEFLRKPFALDELKRVVGPYIS